jgi:hypothetical protein
LPPQATMAAPAAPIAESRKNLRRCSFALTGFPPCVQNRGNFAILFVHRETCSNRLKPIFLWIEKLKCYLICTASGQLYYAELILSNIKINRHQKR